MEAGIARNESVQVVKDKENLQEELADMRRQFLHMVSTTPVWLLKRNNQKLRRGTRCWQARRIWLHSWSHMQHAVSEVASWYTPFCWRVQGSLSPWLEVIFLLKRILINCQIDETRILFGCMTANACSQGEASLLTYTYEVFTLSCGSS